MTIPWPDGRPDQSVAQDSGAQLTQGFQVLARSIAGLERVMQTQTAMMERTINAQQRFQMAGQPQLRQDVLQQVAGAGGSLHGTRQTQVTPMGALSSLENLKAFGAQRLGEWLAGVPLYESPSSQPSGSPGGTPVGTPSSASAPAGAGAQAAARAAAQAAGAPAANAPVNPLAGLGGLPGYMFGGRHAAPVPGTFRGAAVLQQVGARVAMSGGGLGGVGRQLRQLPGIGLGLDLINAIPEIYLKQREAGRAYQEVEGGTNLAAQAERLHMLGYQASMFGRMPEGAAAQAFMGVTQMGFNRAAVGEAGQFQNRQSALDFIYHNYTTRGMDVNQSLQVLQTASQNAVINLESVSQALKSVSDSAGQAGTNAMQARQQFNQYFQAAIGLGAGAGAPQIAGGIAAMQASMGKEFVGVNFTGELSQARQYLLSGMSGLSPAQLQYTARTQPGAYNRLLAGQNMQFLTMGGLMTPEMTSSLQQMIARAGGSRAIASNPTLRDQIAQQFLNEWQLKGNINENLWAQEISAMTGVQMSPDQAFQWIVSQQAGVNEATHNAALRTASTTGGPVSARNTRGAPAGQFGLATGHPGVFSARGAIAPTTWQEQLLHHSGAAAVPYLARERHSGMRSPVLESLMQNLWAKDKVRVQTRSGARVMSFADAMRYYPNELASGNVEFYSASGKTNLGSTASVTHGLVDTNANVTAEERQRAGSNLGVAAGKFRAPGSATVPAGGAHPVTIDLSNEAKQLLKLLPSNYDQAAATSQVPANPWPGQASR
jgi:hypothetical protein